MEMFEIYKRGQGKYTRSLTVAGVMLVVMLGAYVLSDSLRATSLFSNPLLAFGIPTAIVAGFGVFIFWLVNRPQSADFLIATESEMKKVSWSSRKEIVGSTKVVIVTTFIMAAVLFAVDIFFTVVFKAMGVMGAGA